jgi:2-iminobutanoate/2-iminopropanoate deaminase
MGSLLHSVDSDLKEIIRPKGMYDPSFHAYSHGVKVGNLVFVAGQLGTETVGKKRKLVRGGFVPQAKQVFKNIEIILKEAGANLDCDTTMSAYLKNIKDLERFGEIRREVFKRDFPASTTVEVSGFAIKGALVEVNVTAITP